MRRTPVHRRARACAIAVVVALSATGLAAPAFGDQTDEADAVSTLAESRTYAGGPERSFLFDDEYLNTETAPLLREKWSVPTGAIVTGTPAVAAVDLGDEYTRVVYFSSWDGYFYAVRFDTGAEVWRFRYADQPGASYPGAASLHVENIDGREVLIAPAGQTAYAIDAVTGEEIWAFEAGTGCRDAEGQWPGNCGFGAERNEIESSVIVGDGKAFFGMDVNESVTGKGGFYAVDIRTGTLAWYFDVTTGATCTPLPGDEITNYDGYNSAADLGLPEDFFETRPGCDHARDPNGCGSVWSSAAYDPERDTIYFGGSNCYTSEDPTNPRPHPPMPPFDEAVTALDTDGNPQWRWRVREVDNADLGYGAVPNLFSIDVDGEQRDVVGIGNKDGSYTVLDRDGLNVRNDTPWDDPDAATDFPYWRVRVVPGGGTGGVISTASVDDVNRRVRFSTASGANTFNPQRPTVHVVDMDTGAIIWQHDHPDAIGGDASYGPTSGTRDVVVTGTVLVPFLRFFDAATGELVAQHNIAPGFFGGSASGPVIIDGTILAGHGIGQRSSNPNNQAHLASWTPSSLVALCVPGAPGCEDPVTHTANFSDAQCDGLEAIADALGLESIADVVRMGVDGWAGVHASGGSAILTEPVPNAGPCEVEVTWSAEEADRIADAAAGWGVTENELHHLGGWIVIYLIVQAAASAQA